MVVVTGCHVSQELLLSARARLEIAAKVVKAVDRIL